MNLTKLFNFKYLKQNLKKSKGILTLIALVIPIITALVLIAYNSESYVSALSDVELALINIIGMYVVPIIISSALYGYVYKKNSVDFINSMPMSRSTIYATNFLAGTIIILFSQILTLIVSLVLANTLANVFIPIAIIWDIFVVMFISYIFVFAATSLAMTVSGNLLTQIVVTMLILFLIPFVSLISNEFDYIRDLNLDIGNNVLVLNEVVLPKYSTPFKIFILMIHGNVTSFYNLTSILKMIIVSIVYLILGIYLFNKRKMENVENSFSKTWVHLIVKGITLVPVIFFIMLAEIDEVALGIAITLTFIYYIIYDFITNKKVALKITIPTFVISCVILVGAYKVVNYIGTEALVKNISIDEISSIGVEIGLVEANSIYGNEELDVEITDKNLIQDLCSGLISNERENRYYSTEISTVYNDNKYPVNRDVKLKLKNGKEIYLNTTIAYDTYRKVVNNLLSNDLYKEQYEKMIKFNEIGIIYEGRMLNREDTKKIKEELNKINLQDVMNSEVNDSIYDSLYTYSGFYSRGSSRPTIQFYQYKNHEFRNYYLDKTLSPEIFNIITTSLNRELYKKLTSEGIDLNKVSVYVEDYSNLENKTISHFMKYDEIIKYIIEHANDTCDMNKPYYTFNCYGSSLDRSMYTFLNTSDELEYILEKYRIIEEQVEKTYIYDAKYQ